MRKIKVYIDQKEWDDFRIVKLVNKAGNCKCNIDIISEQDYINVKSISSMMAFFSKRILRKNLEIGLDGEDEDFAADQMQELFK